MGIEEEWEGEEGGDSEEEEERSGEKQEEMNNEQKKKRPQTGSRKVIPLLSPKSSMSRLLFDHLAEYCNILTVSDSSALEAVRICLLRY